jgi:hypothetical protein
MLISDVIFLIAFLLFPWALICWIHFLSCSNILGAHCACFKMLVNSLMLSSSKKEPNFPPVKCGSDLLIYLLNRMWQSDRSQKEWLLPAFLCLESFALEGLTTIT